MKNFFSEDGCPQQDSTPRESLFPYLDHSNLTENEKILYESRLKNDTTKMILLFANTEDSLIKSLESQNISVGRVRNYAANFVRKLGTSEELKKLQNSNTLYDVFFALHRFKSFFHYEIVENIVRQFGNAKDCQVIDKYISEFKEFCKRSVFEVPPNIFHDSDTVSSDKVFAVKFTPEEHASLGDVVAVRKKLADIFNIDVFALQLCCVTDGCVCLRFLVSGQIADEIFPVTENQTSALSDNQIKLVEVPSTIETKESLR